MPEDTLLKNALAGAEKKLNPELIVQESIRDMATKQNERNEYLGELRERVIRCLTLDQVKSKNTYSEILDAIKDSRADHVLIHHSIPVELGAKYEKPAHERGVGVTYVSDPNFTGPVGLVVASDEAVDIENIEVPAH